MSNEDVLKIIGIDKDKVIPQQNSSAEFGVFIKLSSKCHQNWSLFFYKEIEKDTVLKSRTSISADEIKVVVTVEDNLQEIVNSIQETVNSTNERTIQWRKAINDGIERQKQEMLRGQENAAKIKEKLLDIEL